jgi:hypothetical protein
MWVAAHQRHRIDPAAIGALFGAWKGGDATRADD